MKPIVLMLAYNAERTLEKTFQALPASLKPHVVVGDDCSSDRTQEVARGLGLRVVRHERNLNYGGNLKRLFRLFLEEDADVAVEIHADYQYEPALADLMIEYVARGYYDVIQGNRIRTRSEALSGGMPLYRYLGNRTLTLFENLWFGTVFGEWHSGMRAYSRKVIASLPLETYSDTHSFASDILMDCVARGYRVAEVPCPVRYEADSSSVSVPRLFQYTFNTVRTALKYPPWRRQPPHPMVVVPLGQGTAERGAVIDIHSKRTTR
ncbi:MAG: glycosyltransferase family 2 protein [Deltaproteobacteria bacterium]|nr:glycosyltransferase family 2 protein [Deltaproteobacteria bacterium]